MLASLRCSNASLFLLAISFFSARALACSCAVPPPPCEAIGRSQLVFLGTVTEINTQPGSSFKTARMTVDRLFKGTRKTAVDLFDDGMCDAPDLQVGKQFLMYTSSFSNGAVPARGCTRSRSIENADEDLNFLRQYTTGKVSTHIDGTVLFRPDEPEDSSLGDAGRTPLKDVQVTLSSNGKEFRAKTTSVGKYSFSGLAPGEYTIDPELSGYHLDWAPDSIVLVANGCAEADMLMKVDRRVVGSVLDDSGAPIGGALVEMVFTDDKLKRSLQPVLLDISDQDGHYEINGIPPGNYYLGVNINSTPTKEHPYPTTYYPNTPDRNLAMRIGVVGASVQEYDLRVPRRLSLVTVHGKIQTAEGKSPLPQDHPQVRIKEPGLYGQIENETIRIDADGQFQFDLCEGIEYSAFAFSGPIRSAIYSAPVEFTPTKENDRLVLILDKTFEEFRKLRPK